MLIRKKLFTVAGLPAVVVILVGLFLTYTAIKLSRAVANQSRAHAVVFDTFDLTTLTYEYLANPHSRIVGQWNTVHERVEQLLAALSDMSLPQWHAVQEAEAINQDMKYLFDRLVLANTDGEGMVVVRSEVQDELRRHLVGELTTKSRSLAARASRLAQYFDERRNQTLRWAGLLIIAVILVSALVETLLSVLIVRGVTGPISALGQGIRRVGAGELDVKIGNQSQDEIGELSRSFDTMTDKLHSVTVSRDMLAREVYIRERTEKRLKETLAELERSNQELQQFAYVASHDIQEPLRTVTSFVSLLAKRYRGRLDKDADEFIDFITDAATRARELINDLLAYSRAGRKDKPLQRVDANSILAAVLRSLRTSIEDSGARIESQPLPIIAADPTEMTQLFQNLIANALKFSQPGIAPQITITVKEEEGQWEFTIQDNGVGVAPEYRERVFDIFQRLHGMEFPGTGIGLAICQRIVQRHGGNIWIEDGDDNVGTRFKFTIARREGGILPRDLPAAGARTEDWNELHEY